MKLALASCRRGSHASGATVMLVSSIHLWLGSVDVAWATVDRSTRWHYARFDTCASAGRAMQA
eukprot:15479244-Alexandrium_andersonii.AAC.1